MTNINAVHSVGTTLPDPAERLTQVVTQLQGVFVEQLFKAMRETVPSSGVAGGGAGEAMFSSLMDQHLAGAVPSQWDHGIGESLYRQLQSHVTAATGHEAGATSLARRTATLPTRVPGEPR